MLLIPNALFNEYVSHLNKMKIPMARFTEYKKWLRYYLDFCDKYLVPDSKSGRVRLFCEKLKEKKQYVGQRKRAAHAVSLYFEMLNRTGVSSHDGNSGPVIEATSLAERGQSENDLSQKSDEEVNNRNAIENDDKPAASRPEQLSPQPTQETFFISDDSPRYSTDATRRSQFIEAGYQERSASPEWDKVLENMAAEIKVRHYSRKTLQTYALWSRQFQRFLKNKPPQELSTADVKEYLTFLAVKCHVAASTQNQAFHID
jgi:hypothetical protein